MAKKKSGQEEENEILCLKKSLIISKQECAQWEEGFSQLEQGCAQLEKENQVLKEKLGANSGNSPKPSSQDPFRGSRSSRPTGSKPGGQFGHPGHIRALYSENKVTKNVDLFPEECSSCHSKIFEESVTSLQLHQVADISEISPNVTQYRIYTLKCAHCGKKVRAQLPKKAKHSFGPRLQAFLAAQSAEGLISRRRLSSLASYFKIRVSLGSTCNILKRAADLLKNPAKKIQEHVLQQGRIHADEISWRVTKEKSYLWMGATPDCTFFNVNPSRSVEAYKRIFGSFRGTLVTDRYSLCNQHPGRRQSYLAHIDRSLAKMEQREGVDAFCSKTSQKELGKIFALWHEYKAEKFSREELQKRAKDPIENIRTILMFAAEKAKLRQSKSLARNLLKCFSHLWTFLYEKGVKLTNNLAERALRPCVILRKISLGSQSTWEARLIERLMTVAVTLQQRLKNVFLFLTALFESFYEIRPPPFPSSVI